LQYDGKPDHLKALESTTAQLLSILRTEAKSYSFDEKLADYVFFPLSHIFRIKQRQSDRLIELSVQCVEVLLSSGWKSTISVELAKQLLILLSFIAGGTPGKEVNASEELKTEAYKALAALFKALEHTPKGASALVEQSTVPALGHCVSVLIDGITDGPSDATQQQALAALHALWSCIKDQEALASFLPGTISGLTKCLVPTTNTRRSRVVLVAALKLYEKVLLSVVGDIRTRNLDKAPADAKLNKSWLKASASQIKLALSSVIKLRKHADQEVRAALKHLCVVLLDDCHTSLEDSAPILVETWLALANEEEDAGTMQTSLGDLAMIHPSLGDLIKNTLYNWVTSMPRVMQSNDEASKSTLLGQVSQAYTLLSTLGIESGVLDDTLGDSLRNSVSAIIEPSTSKAVEVSDDAEALTLASEVPQDFQPLLMPYESQKQTRNDFTSLIAKLGTTESQVAMASTMMEYVRNTSSQGTLSAFWLSFNLVKAAASRSSDLEDFLSSMALTTDGWDAVMEELHLYSLTVLSEDEQPDWRIQALALEVIAYSAQRTKLDFRPELIDALYPVVHLIGSPNPQLRSHAMTSLNLISAACGYPNTSSLILSNVDYMVNAISLKLNTFDITPQAPQVLVMMIKLSGPSILPFLDDVIGSIFAALDNFHGYPRLVEVLFSVLSEVVSEGSKSTQSLLGPTQEKLITHKKQPVVAPSIAEIVTALKKRSGVQEDASLAHEPFPATPWKSASALLDEAANPPDTADPEEEAPSTELEKPAPTKTYTLLKNITLLAQNYLTSSSPVLRLRLLNLITTSAPALARNEDVFLPVVNEIWPPLINRLYDDESYVVISAAAAIGALCVSAGDFLSMRVKSEWADIVRLLRRAKGRIQVELGKGGRGRGVYSEASKVWEALVGLMSAVIGHVRVEDDMFDEVLDIFAEEVEKKPQLREALECVNADAVWLTMWENGQIPARDTPSLEGFRFTPMKWVKA
jgi:hypothetical protein